MLTSTMVRVFSSNNIQNSNGITLAGLLFPDQSIFSLAAFASPSTSTYTPAPPLLRLVSLHPQLSAKLVFARVPEIQEDFSLKVYFSHACTVQDVVENVCERLGLVRVGRGKGSVVEYALEVIEDGGESDCIPYVQTA